MHAKGYIIKQIIRSEEEARTTNIGAFNVQIGSKVKYKLPNANGIAVVRYTVIRI